MGALVCAECVLGTSILPPESLMDLALRSDCVMVGTVQSSRAGRKRRLPHQAVALTVDTVVSGPVSAGDPLTVAIPGGAIGNRRWLVAGRPELVKGHTYLLFLRKTVRDDWRLSASALGCFQVVQDEAGDAILVPLQASRALKTPPGRPVESLHFFDAFFAEPFLRHLGEALDGDAPWSPSDFVVPADIMVGMSLKKGKGAKGDVDDCLFFTTNQGENYRWEHFDGGQPALINATRDGLEALPSGGAGIVIEALNIWADIPDSRLNLVFNGITDEEIRCTVLKDDYLENTVVFADPCDDIEDLDRCAGVLAYGGPLVEGTHRFDGERWGTITGWLVVVNNGSECVGTEWFTIMLAHELGHGLGFQHFDDPTALMYEECCNTVNDLDTTCVQFAYPAVTPDNQRPQVIIGAGGPLTVYGPSTTLFAAVTDDGLPAVPGRVSVAWDRLQGPADVKFSDDTGLETTVTFSASGQYLLGVTVTDGELLRQAYVSATVHVDAQAPFLRGDANNDGRVDLSDPIAVLLHLFDTNPLSCPDAADANDDGDLNLGDPVFLLGYLFAEEQAPSAPWPGCGEDPTDDDLAPCLVEGCR